MLSEHVFELQAKDGEKIEGIQLIDMTGRPVKYKINLKEQSRLQLESFHKGILILIVDHNGAQQIVRFYK